MTAIKKFVTENRKKLADKLDKGGIAILHANDTMPTNSDGLMHFRQNNDLCRLTGIKQEETILKLKPLCT